MLDLVYYLTNLLFFDIPLLYCYINLRSSIVFCLFFWRYTSFLGNSSLCSFVIIYWTILRWTSWDFCNSISNSITDQINSCFWCFLFFYFLFFLFFFEVVLSTSVADCLACSRTFWLYLLLTFSFIFLSIFLPIF